MYIPLEAYMMEKLGKLLSIPPEPVDIKMNFKKRMEEGDKLTKMSIKQGTWIASILWTDTRWKTVLKDYGLRWQDMMKVIRECYYSFLDWIEGKRSWDDVINYIVLGLERELKYRKAL